MPIALPGVSASSPPSTSQARTGYRISDQKPGDRGGIVRLVSPAELDESDRTRAAARANAVRATIPTSDLGAYVRRRWMIFRNHRNTGVDPTTQRLLRAQRMFEGKYDPEKLAEIKKFGGSEVYSRIVASKCRAASALLRDVYLGPTRPWDIQPQPDPPVPPDVKASIAQLVAVEVAGLKQSGAPILQDQVHMRMIGLLHAAQQAARRNAQVQADSASDKIEDILVEGGFYSAMEEFIQDLPLFPFACIKGPVVRMVPRLIWRNGQPLMRTQPHMFWERKSPFDIYWTPGAHRIEDAEVIEIKRYTRTDLNDLIGLPGYDERAVRGALEDYSNGLREWLESADTERALNERRENPNLNFSNMIDGLEYHGNVQGRLLLDQGVDKRLIPDLDRDYSVQTWVVGQHTLKTQINPSPRQRHSYFITSYEKVPGTIIGHGLPDILEDLQDVGNAVLRSLVNNMSISSGPQVVINDDAVDPGLNSDDLYPWKRWHVQNDPVSTNREPVTFFQPQSNAQELLTVYSAVIARADEESAIPRYLSGSGQAGGGAAGRTASGLSMLMDNASKVLQNVASNVDNDIITGILHGLYDMIMLTDQSGMLTGEEEVRVRGVNVAVQKEVERQHQMQFLQITANPIDAPIVGELGRARVLRAVSQGLGLPDDVVPDDNTIQQKMDAQKRMAAVMAATQPPAPPQQGQPHPQPGGHPTLSPAGGPPPVAQGVPQPGPSGQPSSGPSGGPPPTNLFQQQPSGVPT